MTNETYDLLNEMQENIDELYLDYVKKEYEIKLAHHKKMEKILAERDALFREKMSREELNELFLRAFTSFDVVQDFLPLNAQNKYDSSFIKFLKAEYLDNERLKVTLELYDNDYVKNDFLEKTIYLTDRESECTKVEWKDEPRPCILFNFFDVDEESFDLFDLIYEFYINMVAYSTLED